MRGVRHLTTAEGEPMLARMRSPVLVLLAIALVGCAAAPDGAVALQTRPQQTICLAARVGGVLVADSNYGLAYQVDGGVHGVIWPHAYSARRVAGVVFLIDPSGRKLAREGDRIVSAGSYGPDGIALPCGDLQVNPPGN